MEIDDEHAEVEIIDYNAQCGNNVSSPHLICVFIFWSCDPKMLAHAMPPLFFSSLQLTFPIQFNYGPRSSFLFLYLFHFTPSFSQIKSTPSLIHRNILPFNPYDFLSLYPKSKPQISRYRFIYFKF